MLGAQWAVGLLCITISLNHNANFIKHLAFT